MKEFFYHKPYGKVRLFKEKVDKADFEKLAKLIKIVGLLLQTKVYLFWSARKKNCIMPRTQEISSAPSFSIIQTRRFIWLKGDEGTMNVAEKIVQTYLRLNGFFTIPKFTLLGSKAGHIDIIAVRIGSSKEIVRSREKYL